MKKIMQKILIKYSVGRVDGMTDSKPEKVIEREILIYLNKLDKSFFWKNDTVGIYDETKRSYRRSPNPYSIKGVSDIVGILRGQVFFIEVKTAKGNLSLFQKHFIEKINNLGGNAFVARSVEDVKQEFLKRGLEC